MSLYAREKDVRCALKMDKPMILLLYKEAYLNETNHNPSLPSVVVSLLQEFRDVLLEEMPLGLGSRVAYPKVLIHGLSKGYGRHTIPNLLQVLRFYTGFVLDETYIT